MAEKTSEKKDNQHKNKNGKLQEKKKKKKPALNVNSKGLQPAPVNHDSYTDPLKKKKNKKNKTNNLSNHKNDFHKSSKKKTGSAKKSLLRVFFTQIAIVTLVLGFIYIVDFEKFVRIRDGASFYVNKTISFLPPAVVTKARETFKYIEPVMEVTFNKVNVLANETSTFFNTNPLVKDHWTNIKEISLICSARLVDYMRTLYLQASQYCNDFKSKLFH